MKQKDRLNNELEPELKRYLSRQQLYAALLLSTGILCAAGIAAYFYFGWDVELPIIWLFVLPTVILLSVGMDNLRSAQCATSRIHWLLHHIDAKELSVEIEAKTVKIFQPTATEPVIVTARILHRFSKNSPEQTSASKNERLEQVAQVRSDLFLGGISIIETSSNKYWGIVIDSSLAPKNKLLGSRSATTLDLVMSWRAFLVAGSGSMAALCILFLSIINRTIIFDIGCQLIILASAASFVLSFEWARMIRWVTLRRLRQSTTSLLDKASVMALGFAYLSQEAQCEADACNELLLITDDPPGNSMSVEINHRLLPSLKPGFPAQSMCLVGVLLTMFVTMRLIENNYPGLERPFKTERYNQTRDSEYSLIATEDPAASEAAYDENNGKKLPIKKGNLPISPAKDSSGASTECYTPWHDDFKGERELTVGANAMFSEQIDNFGCNSGGIEIIAKGSALATGLLDRPRALVYYMESELGKQKKTAIWLQHRSDGSWWGQSADFILPHCDKQVFIIPAAVINVSFYVDAIKQGSGDLEVVVQPMNKLAIMDLNFKQKVSVDMDKRDIDDPNEWPDSKSAINTHTTKQPRTILANNATHAVANHPARVSGYAVDFPDTIPDGYYGGNSPNYSYFNSEGDGPARIASWDVSFPRGQLRFPVPGRIELMVNQYTHYGHLPYAWKFQTDLKKKSTRAGGIKSVAGLNFKTTYWKGKIEGSAISGVDYLAQDGKKLVGIRGYNYGDENSTAAATAHVVESLHRVVNDDKPMSPEVMAAADDAVDPSKKESHK